MAQARNAAEVTPDDVVDAAFALLRDHGLAGVSVRALAAMLGISPMTVYARVGSKEQLFDAMAGRLARTLVFDTDAAVDWRDGVKAWAMSLRRQLLVHPDAIGLFNGRPWAVARALTPLFDCLRTAGYHGERNVRASRLLSWAVFGFIHVEADRVGRQHGDGAVGDDPPVSRPLAAGAFAGRLGDEIPLATQEEVDSMFDNYLDLLMGGLE